ncbi:hypothetical protein QFC19_000684 [Naganishia cerealis]|uniref:Uncharacterized protein n=1 Tax=Naganishia cerealis TaxID=610337 RepID=A0ACC2WLS0_9TREE|nr:hypothetical protein QFC19_000684 [Naganishia cerealis]
MDIALNAMDEPTIVVPWEDLAGYMREGQKTRYMIDIGNVVTEFQKLPTPREDPQSDRKPTEKNWGATGPF